MRDPLPLPDTSPTTEPTEPEPAPTPTPTLTEQLRAAMAAPESDPADFSTPAPTVEVGRNKLDDIGPDRAFLYAVLQAGPAGVYKARELGVRPQDLRGEEQRAYTYVEGFARKGRLPELHEIKHATGWELPPAPALFDIDLYAQKILNRSLFGLLQAGLGPVVRRLLPVDPRAARDALVKLCRETSHVVSTAASWTDPAVAHGILAAYDKAKARQGGLLGLSSPWSIMDRQSMGLQEGELTVIMAKRKTGKSWVLFRWFLHILQHDLQPGENLLIVSMEMPDAQVWRRLGAIELKLPYGPLRAGQLSPPDEQRLRDWVAARQVPDLTKPTIHVVGPNKVRDVDDIAAKVAELGPRAVGIDGLYILGRDTKAPMWERTQANVSGIKLEICAQHSVPVVATTQFAGSKKKDELKADSDDAAFAKSIGDYADAVRGLVMDAGMEEKKERVFLGMESREFKAASFLMRFDLDTMDFSELRDLTPGAQQPQGNPAGFTPTTQTAPAGPASPPTQPAPPAPPTPTPPPPPPAPPTQTPLNF